MIDELPASGTMSFLLALWPADPRPADPRPGDARPADTWPADTWLADSWPADEAASSPPATILVTVAATRAEAPLIGRLAKAGIPVLGYADLAYATRPPAELRSEVAHLAQAPVDGIFLDRAPTTPYAIGPVALAVRSARRAGLRHVIVNPGLPADPVYDTLGAAICAVEGTWPEYLRMPDHEFRPGSGHLVHGVPPGDLPAARELMRRRRAAFGFASDRQAPGPYALVGRSGALAAAR
jgi:hypothetical protein